MTPIETKVLGIIKQGRFLEIIHTLSVEQNYPTIVLGQKDLSKDKIVGKGSKDQLSYIVSTRRK